MRDELLGYYERELVFLRQLGAEFAHKYPKIASRLLLEGDACEDPHVERMIEAFAFLAGRVHLKINDEFPEITEAFLNVLYPHYLAPIPSMAIVEFAPGVGQDKLTTGQNIERATKLYSRPVDGTPCRFQTCYPVTLWPLEVESAALESLDPVDTRGKWSESVLRISLKCSPGVTLEKMKMGGTEEPIKSVRFYINGEPQITYPLYEMLFNHTTRVELRARDNPSPTAMLKTMSRVRLKPPPPVILPPTALEAVGFGEDEKMLPYTARSFAGYRLLTEYFTFAQKFMFFEVGGLDQAARNKFDANFDILIYFKDVVPPRGNVTTDNIKLGCAPIVNLFTQPAEPIYLSQQQHEYHVMPDVYRQMATEVYSIDEVITSDPRSNQTREFYPFYSFQHAYEQERDRTFWYASRRQSHRAEDPGTEVYMSLVDLNFSPHVPAVEILNVRATCTNRDLPGKLPFGGREGDFEVEGTGLISRVRCLTKPTETVRPPLRKGAQWRLISHLGLNHLSLVENARNSSPDALQEILQLYDFTGAAATRRQIVGITGVESRRVTRQIGQRIGSGFVRGLETTIEFDEEQYVGSGLFLFTTLLDRFLALYASINSFNQLVVKTKQREGEYKRWPPRAGEKILL